MRPWAGVFSSNKYRNLSKYTTVRTKFSIQVNVEISQNIQLLEKSLIFHIFSIHQYLGCHFSEKQHDLYQDLLRRTGRCKARC